MVAFTQKGAVLCARLCLLLGSDCTAYAPEKYCAGPLRPLTVGVGEWAGQRFLPGGALVFVGAAGIAIRAIARHICGKDRDPAVLCIDNTGRYVIPLLSGHLGGANRLALELAALCGGEAVLTTATDRGGVFSPDAWAAENNCAIGDIGEIKHIAAALLDGEIVGFVSDFPVDGPLPDGVASRADAEWGISVSHSGSRPFAHTLELIPRCIVAGMGCRRGVEAAVLRCQLVAALEEKGLPLAAVGAVASIDRKADEPGLLTLCSELRVPFLLYTAGQLMAVQGAFTASERVLAVTGADNVCERAAVLAGGGLIAPKFTGNGVAIALSRREWRAEFMLEGGVQ